MLHMRFLVALGMLIPLISLLPAAPISAQEPITNWTQHYESNNGATGIAADSTGNVYLVGTEGYSPDPNGGRIAQVFVRQYHSDGSQGWMQELGTDGPSGASGVAVDAAGNVYVAGETDNALPGRANSGGRDAFVRQYHGDGSQGWTSQFGSPAEDDVAGVAVDGAGNVYVAGSTWGSLPGQSSSGLEDAFARQYRPDGSEGWVHQFGSAEISGIAASKSGMVYVFGVWSAQWDDYFVRQYRADGTEGWTHWYDWAGEAGQIAVDWEGNAYATGTIQHALSDEANAGYDHTFVRQYLPNSNEGWTRQFGTSDNDFPAGIAVDGWGNVYVAGTTWGSFPGYKYSGNGDVFVQQFHADGSSGWTIEFGTEGFDRCNGVAVSSGGAVYIVGALNGTIHGSFSTQGFVTKLLSPDGSSGNPSTPVSPFTSTADRGFFPETNHSLAYGFKSFWEHNGGSTAFGYPLTEEFQDFNATSGTWNTVQYTERQRFEYHPELAGTPYLVELGLLGSADAQRNNLLTTQPFQPLPATTLTDGNCTFFPETGHRLCFGFKSYWQSHGLDLGDPGISFRESLALFGYPISEEFVDPNSGFVTQYFQRAVFEYHPENAGTPYTVLLKRLGASELHARGWLP